MYLKCDLETFKLPDLNCKFDVILLEPPLEEYQGVHDVNYKHWNWKQVASGFVWMLEKVGKKLEYSLLEDVLNIRVENRYFFISVFCKISL